jgi:putative tricarboxylic transport membrane protein
VLGELLTGFSIIFTWENLLIIMLGAVVGIAIGALPGLGPTVGTALMLPITFGMEPVSAIVLLVAVYMTAEYGGSITAILIATPGTTAATATVVDGYELTKKGLPGKALGASLTASTVGGIITTFVLVLFAVPLMSFALKFGPAEYFALGVFGLSLVASLSGKSLAKGLLMAILGLLIASIGLDPLTGQPRFTFGSIYLYEGVPLIAALIGLYALSEVFVMFLSKNENKNKTKSVARDYISFKEFKGLLPVILQSSFIGSIVGVIPGAGGSIAAWLAYQQSKRIAKDKEEYGKGALSGVAAPEASNNATVGGALIPLLSLGIPGSPTTAILLGAFMLHGLSPGVDLMETDAEIFYGIVVGLLVTCIFMFIIGYFMTNFWVKIISIPQSIIAPIVFAISIIGVFSIRNSMFDVYIALALGVLGFFLRKFNFPLAPIVLALVLGGMIESNLRRSLLISEGSWMIFLTNPISLVLIIISVLTFFIPIINSFKESKGKTQSM